MRGHRLHRVGPRHRFRSPGARQLDDEIGEADKRSPPSMTKPTPKESSARRRGSGPSSQRPSWVTGRLQPLRQPRRRALLHWLCAQDHQSGLVAGHKGITKAGDAGLRQALYLAADHARHIDPTIAQRYFRMVIVEGKHHNSALCSVSAVLITRIAACWRKGELYELRDEDGEAITEAEGKAACADRFKIDPKVRAARRRNTPAKTLKNRRRVLVCVLATPAARAPKTKSPSVTPRARSATDMFKTQSTRTRS